MQPALLTRPGAFATLAVRRVSHSATFGCGLRHIWQCVCLRLTILARPLWKLALNVHHSTRLPPLCSSAPQSSKRPSTERNRRILHIQHSLRSASANEFKHNQVLCRPAVPCEPAAPCCCVEPPTRHSPRLARNPTRRRSTHSTRRVPRERCEQFRPAGVRARGMEKRPR